MGIIELQGVTKQYAMGEVTVDALRGLDFDIERGELVVLLGPSGCGKTTTLNLIGGLDKPTSGQIAVGGRDITRLSEHDLTQYRRDTIGFVFQFFNLIPTLTAAENVLFALTLTHRRAVRDTAVELLNLVGLRERANHFPSELSGGEQQRVAIARALANRPPVLLCDEPTGNLDVGTGVQVLEVIRTLNRSDGSTVVLVTHNTAIATIADRVVRLHNGAIDRVDRVDHPVSAADVTW